MEQAVYRGRIVALHGSWGSGLAVMIIDDKDRGLQHLHCDNGTTVRSLEGAFGNAIGPGHTINQKGFAGKAIYYSEDFMGGLDGFTPVKGAPDRVKKAYRETKQKEAQHVG